MWIPLEQHSSETKKRRDGNLCQKFGYCSPMSKRAAGSRLGNAFFFTSPQSALWCISINVYCSIFLASDGMRNKMGKDFFRRDFLNVQTVLNLLSFTMHSTIKTLFFSPKEFLAAAAAHQFFLPIWKSFVLEKCFFQLKV